MKASSVAIVLGLALLGAVKAAELCEALNDPPMTAEATCDRLRSELNAQFRQGMITLDQRASLILKCRRLFP